MKRKAVCSSIISALLLGSMCLTAVADTKAPTLPTIETHGVQYYYYKVSKGESIYGLCKRNGWDEETLRKCNNNLAEKVKKGQAVYYPVNPEALEVRSEKPKENTIPLEHEPIKHIVKRGESVYSIAHLYGVPVDVVYAQNPSAHHGIKAGETLTIVQPTFSDGAMPFYYTVKVGDTLYSIAQKYNSSVESIMKNNPGVSESTFRAGTNIKITPNTSKSEWKSEQVDREVVKSFNSQQVMQGDTWETLSTRTGVTADEIKEANPGVNELKKGTYVYVPQVESVRVTAPVFVPDAAETTTVLRDSIYRQVHNLGPVSAERKVNVTVVLENPSTKSNLEFLRGFLMGVDNQKTSGYKINMHVMAGNGIAAQDNDSILRHSSIIIGVYDNDFPEELAKIGDRAGVEVVNVFDSKSELFRTNPSMIQILQPIDYFNDVEGNYFADRFAGRNLIFIGEIDRNDKMAQVLHSRFPAENITYLSLEELANYPFDDDKKYAVYSYAVKKDAIEGNLDALTEVMTSNPMTTISLIGRPQWIAYTQSLGEKYSTLDTYIPSRFFMRPDSEEINEFGNRFKSIYGQTLSNSYPQYAVLGYDIANCFLPMTAENGGDYNLGVRYREGIQNDIDISRHNTWSGFINGNAYVIHVTPLGNYEKIEIK